MKKGKKNLKGMTLIEMIISIAVFAALCGVLVMVGTHIDATSRATNNLKDKIVKEAPYAANRVKEYIDKDNKLVEFPSKQITIEIDYGKKVEVKAKKYETENIVLDGRSAKSQENIKNGFNSGLNLDYIRFPSEDPKTETETPTEATPAEPGP